MFFVIHGEIYDKFSILSSVADIITRNVNPLFLIVLYVVITKLQNRTSALFIWYQQ